MSKSGPIHLQWPQISLGTTCQLPVCGSDQRIRGETQHRMRIQWSRPVCPERRGANIQSVPRTENLTNCILSGELFSNPSIINTLRDTNESPVQVKCSTYEEFGIRTFGKKTSCWLGITKTFSTRKYHNVTSISVNKATSILSCNSLRAYVGHILRRQFSMIQDINLLSKQFFMRLKNT